LNDAFPSKTSSLSSILGSFRFYYLLDDPMNLLVGFTSTQTSIIPRGETRAERRDKSCDRCRVVGVRHRCKGLSFVHQSIKFIDCADFIILFYDIV